ncbi:MAG: hypothetical protein HYS13_04605 [Planctomycetia bacterium]|nr:hypothetical protein [Planctomycetia bacterium]
MRNVLAFWLVLAALGTVVAQDPVRYRSLNEQTRSDQAPRVVRVFAEPAPPPPPPPPAPQFHPGAPAFHFAPPQHVIVHAQCEGDCPQHAAACQNGTCQNSSSQQHGFVFIAPTHPAQPQHHAPHGRVMHVIIAAPEGACGNADCAVAGNRVYFLGETAENGCNCPACRCAKQHQTQTTAACKNDCNCACGSCSGPRGAVTAHIHAPSGQAQYCPQDFQIELASGAECQQACCPHEGCTDVSLSPNQPWPIGQPCTIADSKGRTHQGVLCHANDEWLVLDTGHGRKWIRASIVETVTEQPDHVGYAPDQCDEECVATRRTAEGLIFSHPVRTSTARWAAETVACPADREACDAAMPRNKLRATVKLQSTPPFFGIDVERTKAEQCDEAPKDLPLPPQLPTPPHLPAPPQRTAAAPPSDDRADIDLPFPKADSVSGDDRPAFEFHNRPAGVEIAVEPRIVGGHVVVATTARPAREETQYAVELKLTKNEDGQKTLCAPKLTVTADQVGHLAVGDFKCGVCVKEGHEGYLTLQVFSGLHAGYPRATCTMKSGDGVTLSWGDDASLEVKVHRMDNPERATRETTP